MDTIDFQQFYLDNADEITLLQDGEYEELYQRFSESEMQKKELE